MSCCNNTKSNQEGMLIVNKAREAAACAEANCASSFTNATNSAISATNSANSASESNNYLTQVTNIFNNFDQRYLGSKAVAPTTDNQGNPLQEGALYFNSVSDILFAWNGSSWITATNFNELTPFISTGTITARNLVTRMKDVVSVLDFGADPSGVANSTAAFTAMFASGAKCCEIPSGNYRIASTVSIPSNICINAYNAKLIAASSGLTVLLASNISDWSINGDLKIQGVGKSNGSGVGIKIEGCKRFNISGVTISDIDGIGFLQRDGLATGLYGDNGRFTNCMAINCWIGFEQSANPPATYSNEYNTYTSINATGCEIGIKTSPGNNSFIGGKITNNNYGFYMVPGTNATHGTMVGVQLNHNNVNVYADGQTAGFIFSGCTFLYAIGPTYSLLDFVNSRGIQIVGCLLASNVNSSGAYNNISIIDCYTKDDIAFGGTHPKTIYKRGNMIPDGVNAPFGGPASWNDQGMDYVNSFKSATQPLTSGVAATVVFDTVFDNLRDAYDNTTGIYTCPYSGTFRVTTGLRVNGSFTSGFITLKRNGGAEAFQTLGLAVGYGVATASYDFEMFAGDTITISVTAVGTSLNVDTAPGSFLKIQGL